MSHLGVRKPHTSLNIIGIATDHLDWSNSIILDYLGTRSLQFNFDCLHPDVSSIDDTATVAFIWAL